MELPKTTRRSPSTPYSIYFGGLYIVRGQVAFLDITIQCLLTMCVSYCWVGSGSCALFRTCRRSVESGECGVLQAEHSYVNWVQGASRALLSGVHAQRNLGLPDRGQCQCWRWSLQADRDAQVAASTTSLQHFAKQVSQPHIATLPSKYAPTSNTALSLVFRVEAPFPSQECSVIKA